MKRICIIIDLDGTLADCEPRRYHVNGEAKDFGAFFAAIGDDKPFEWCDELITAMSRYGYDIVLCSGRPEDYRKVTELWLTFNRIEYDALFMRPSGDGREDAIVKKEILERDILPKWDVLFAVDDRQQVVDMWRENGITCLQCAEGDF
jgi:hypothetical protein